MQRSGSAEAFRSLTPEAANSLLSGGELKTIDVREGWEYMQGHIPHAKLTTLGEIIAHPQRAVESDSVVFVCEVGQRSAVAAEIAAAMGMRNVFHLQGGMQAWRAAGLPVSAEQP